MGKQELSIDNTVSFAKQIYGDAQTATEMSLFVHCWSVAKLAERIAQTLFQDMRGDAVPSDVSDIIAAIVHTSLLLESIQVQRKTFEGVADITNVQVASMVSTLSRDLRLVETKRDIEYRGRMSQSPVATQIVAVAAIICTANETIELLKNKAVAAIPKARKIIAQLDGDLLCAHAASRYYTLRLYAHAARNSINDANQLIKKLKADARMARTVEKQVAGIRSRQAAKTVAHPEEKKNGKKRTNRRSS